MTILTPAYVFDKYNTHGVPDSGEKEPKKAEVVQLLERIEQSSAAGIVVRQTEAQLLAVTPSTNEGAWVLNDPDPTKNGYWFESAGAWEKGRGFPDTFARATFGGTANAQTMTLETGVNPADVEVYFGVVTTENTGPMTLNGTTVVNAAGNALSSGEWTGTVLFIENTDGDYQLIIDAGAAAAAAQSATDAAASEAAAEQALNDFTERYLGAFADDAAATAAAGGSPLTGAEYWDSTLGKRKTFDGSAWVANSVAVGDGDVTEPKLNSALSQVLAYVAPSKTVLRAIDSTRYELALYDGSEWEWDADVSSLMTGSDVVSSAVDDTTDTITSVAHGFKTGQSVITSTAVNGLSLNTLYYMIKVDADNYKLAAGFADAIATVPTAVNLTGTTAVTVQRHYDPLQALFVTPTADISGASGAWKRKWAGEIDARWAGVTADDNSTDETEALQAALYLAGITGGFNRGAVRVPYGQRVVFSRVTVPTNVSFLFDGAYLNVTGSNSIRMNTGSHLIGYAGRIQSLSAFSGAVIVADDATSATSLVKILGFQLNGADKTNVAYIGISLDSFYQSEIYPIDIRGFGRAYQQTGSVQCYYNKIHINVFDCGRALITLGTLFNGNIIFVHRCVVDVTGLDIRDCGSNTIINGYIDAGYTEYGLRFSGTGGIGIFGGTIELSAIGINAISSALVCSDTTIVGVRHGGDGSSADWVAVGSGCTNTTITGPYGQFFCHDGAISDYNNGGLITSLPTLANDNPAAANVYIGSDGILYHSTSTLKDKTDLRPITDEQIAAYMTLSGFTYAAKNGDPSKRAFGMAAEHALDAGLVELVDFGADGEPAGYHYGRDMAILLEVVKRQEARIAALEGNRT